MYIYILNTVQVNARRIEDDYYLRNEEIAKRTEEKDPRLTISSKLV